MDQLILGNINDSRFPMMQGIAIHVKIHSYLALLMDRSFDLGATSEVDGGCDNGVASLLSSSASIWDLLNTDWSKLLSGDKMASNAAGRGCISSS